MLLEAFEHGTDVENDPRVTSTQEGDLPSPKLEYDPSKNCYSATRVELPSFPLRIENE